MALLSNSLTTAVGSDDAPQKAEDASKAKLEPPMRYCRYEQIWCVYTILLYQAPSYFTVYLFCCLGIVRSTTGLSTLHRRCAQFLTMKISYIGSKCTRGARLTKEMVGVGAAPCHLC